MCEAKIEILIKNKITENTRKNGIFLKNNPPLCGKITLINIHNHTIKTSGSLKYLRINLEVSVEHKILNYKILAVECVKFIFFDNSNYITKIFQFFPATYLVSIFT